MKRYVDRKRVDAIPRLPSMGMLDLTYRCNNKCRHCWIAIPPSAPEADQELSIKEIRAILDQARQMGTRSWCLSGGEPTLREDFPEIFHYITRKFADYHLNTNGTSITKKIARLLRRPGKKMVALYGADARVHDHITRNPGSFDATLRGLAYMKEERANFTVQLVPMRDNRHQLKQMLDLAQSYGQPWRYGAVCLRLSASGAQGRNAEICSQRLSPSDVVVLDGPDFSAEYHVSDKNGSNGCSQGGNREVDNRFFQQCIANRNDFHVDPYGGMSFCSFVQAPFLRFNLRRGSFREAWDTFIPAIPDRLRGDDEWRAHCGTCGKRHHCRWCPAYAYLETGRFSAPVPYLCKVAEETVQQKEQWLSEHTRYFSIAGITICIESGLSMKQVDFAESLHSFEVSEPGEDVVKITHSFGLPNVSRIMKNVPVYQKAPWSIYKYKGRFVYLMTTPGDNEAGVRKVAEFNADFTTALIFSPSEDEEKIRTNGFPNLTLFPTDQILMAQLLAARGGFYVHASGVVIENRGLLFVGRSGAGKSTVTRMLGDQGKILCDDRIIVRRWNEGFRLHGTWHRGDVADVSPDEAPLKALFFLNKAKENKLERILDPTTIAHRLLVCLIKPLATREWCELTLQSITKLVREVPCYVMHFDESGEIVPSLREAALGIR